MRFLIAFLLISILCVSTFVRNRVFYDEITFWSDPVAKSSRKARPYYNLGQAYLAAGGRQSLALPLFRRALLIDPDYVDARFNLATTLYDLGMNTEAAREFTLIIDRYPFSRKAPFARAMVEMIRSGRH